MIMIEREKTIDTMPCGLLLNEKTTLRVNRELLVVRHMPPLSI